MFNGSPNFSLADVAAVTRNNGNDDGWGGGNGWWVLIILFAIFGGWGNNGYGNRGNEGASQGALTRGDLCQDMNFSDIESSVRGVQSGLCDGFYAMNTGMLNGFSGIQQTLCQGFGGINTALQSQGYETRLATQQLSSQLADCCCKTQTGLESIRTQNAMNLGALQSQIQSCCCDAEKMNMQSRFDAQQYNCTTLQAIEKLGDRIIDRMCAKETQDLRDEVQALRLAASQQAQNQYLIHQLRPQAEPAYLVPNPNGCDCNGGCGFRN